MRNRPGNLRRSLAFAALFACAGCTAPGQPTGGGTATAFATRAGLVGVMAEGSDRGGTGAYPTGSGVAIGTTGIVATAAHVVAGGEPGRIAVRTPAGERHPASVTAFAPQRDLALLCVPGLAGRAGARLASAPPPAGEPVIALAFAAGGMAVVAGRVAPQAASPVRYGTFAVAEPLVLELSIRPGFSGGPVVNGRGELLGILAGFAIDRAARRELGIAYAVPAATLLDGTLGQAIADCRLRSRP
ncbi:Putative serine protease HhoA [bacterium HR40]|nr:Putative serine protease HhoA [bacterium HR40]